MDDLPVQGKLHLMTCHTTNYELGLPRFPESTRNCSFYLKETHFRFCLDYPILHLCLRFASRVSPHPPHGLLYFN